MNGTVVSQYDAAHDGKSEAGSIFLIGHKRPENGLLVFDGNSTAVVFDGNHQPFVVSKYFQSNSPAFGNGFHRIFNQIDKRLP